MSDKDARRPARRALTLDAVDAGAVVGAVGDSRDAANAAPRVLLDMMRRLRARERGHLASLLHDGPIQELATLALELGELSRSMATVTATAPATAQAMAMVTPAAALPGDEPADLAQQVHAAGRTLCRLQDELWPFPRPGCGLVEALKERTGWLLAAPLAVALGQGAAELSGSDVQVVADVTELILVGLGNAEAWERPIVAIRADPALIFLELNMTPAPTREPTHSEPAHSEPAGGGPAVSGSIAAAGGSIAVVGWLHRLAAAIQARADIGLDERRLRICMEIPRCPGTRRDARTWLGGPSD